MALHGQFGNALNNVLFNIKGGAAVTSDRSEDILPQVALFWAQRAKLVGAVLDRRIEYDRLVIGGTNVTFAGPTGLPVSNKQLTRDVDLFTVRVNYMFGAWRWRGSEFTPARKLVSASLASRHAASVDMRARRIGNRAKGCVTPEYRLRRRELSLER